MFPNGRPPHDCEVDYDVVHLAVECDKCSRRAQNLRTRPHSRRTPIWRRTALTALPHCTVLLSSHTSPRVQLI